MQKSQKKATTATKTKTKSKAPEKKQGCVSKRKPEDDPTDSKESSDPEPTYLQHRKHVKQSVDDGMDIVDDGPEVVISLVSGSDRDETRSSDEEVRSWAHSITQ